MPVVPFIMYVESGPRNWFIVSPVRRKHSRNYWLGNMLSNEVIYRSQLFIPRLPFRTLPQQSSKCCKPILVHDNEGPISIILIWWTGILEGNVGWEPPADCLNGVLPSALPWDENHKIKRDNRGIYRRFDIELIQEFVVRPIRSSRECSEWQMMDCIVFRIHEFFLASVRAVKNDLTGHCPTRGRWTSFQMEFKLWSSGFDTVSGDVCKDGWTSRFSALRARTSPEIHKSTKNCLQNVPLYHTLKNHCKNLPWKVT